MFSFKMFGEFLLACDTEASVSFQKQQTDTSGRNSVHFCQILLTVLGTLFEYVYGFILILHQISEGSALSTALIFSNSFQHLLSSRLRFNIKKRTFYAFFKKMD